jgi:hypothetical protein
MRETVSDFFKGFIAGAVVCFILVGAILGMVIFYYRDREVIEYAERQNEIRALREDYGNRDSFEFFDNIPGVRGAAEDAAGEFRRKRDEAVERFRSGRVD